MGNLNNLAIEVTVAHDAWNEIDGLMDRIELALCKTVQFASLNLRSGSEVSVLLTDDTHMRELNLRWRGQDKSTNVLSFPADDIKVGQAAGPLLGDIVLAYETVTNESHLQEKTIENHVSHLVIHGFLHLFGYDHIDDPEAKVMEQLETETLAKLGIDDPYDELEPNRA